ncbi:thymopoietin a isoform X2 [Osmerus eperlanus]|uniref:thymopoietin a isoform X2 n=1 Tax=Osmerus eperlanus TaxID=29151 RepID=UPI002E1252F8
MPEYLEDPSVLTKDKLKSELLANNVALPSGDQRKDVYVQLYLKSLTVQNKKNVTLDAFSSDEELPTPVVSNKSRSGRKATRKTDKPSPEDLDVTELTSEGLKDELLKYGVNAGPIVASTRKLYERKLQKLLDQGPPELVVTPPVVTEIDSNHNGNSDSDRYSDKEEEDTPAPEPVPEPVPVPVVERPVRSRGKTPVTTRTRSSQHNRTNEQLFDEDEEDDVGDLEEAQPVLNIKRRARRTSFRVDQTAAVSEDTDLSEFSLAEVAPPPPALHTTPRHAKPEGIPNEPRPLLADLPVQATRQDPLSHGSSKTKLPAQSSSLPKPKTALQTQQKRQSLPLLKPKAMSQPRSTSAVYLVIPDSPSHSPKGMQLLQPTSEPVLLSSVTEGSSGLNPGGPSGRIHLHRPPQGHRAPDSTHCLPTWQPNWKPSEEDVSLPLTPIQAASPSPVSLLNTALIQDPDQSVDAPVGKSTRPQRLAPYKVFPQEVSPHVVGLPSKPSAWPQTRGDPGAFCFSPVGHISSTPLPTQLYAHAGFAQFDSPDELLSLDQHESTDVPLPKGRHSKMPLILPSTVTPVRRRGAVSLLSKDPGLGEVEKIAAGDQSSRGDEGDLLKEMFPNNVNTPTGINATCRQPIRGAAGRPLKSSDLWLENSLLHSPRETTSTSSYRESHVVHRVTSLPPPPPSFSSSFSSSRLVSAAVAPPAVQPKARQGLSMWLQLLLLSALAGFLFFVYQAMETNAISPFGGSSSSGSAQVGSDSTADVPSK